MQHKIVSGTKPGNDGAKSPMKFSNLYKVTYLAAFIIALGLIIIGCSEGDKLMESKKDQDVVLISGSSDEEVVWHIKNVRRVNKYISEKDTVVHYGDAIAIEGECISKSQTTPFFEGHSDKKKPIFILEDSNGNQFEHQMDQAKGIHTETNNYIDEFTVVFSIAGDNSVNASINSWADLVAKDPDGISKDLPGHIISLGAFDPSS